MNVAKAIEGIPVVGSTAERAVLFPAPATDQRVFRRDTRSLERWNGAVWVIESLGKGDSRVFNVKTEGLILDSVSDDRTAFDTLVNTTMQPNGGQLDVVGVPRIASNITVPKNVTLKFLDGAYLAPDGGVTVTIKGKMRGAPNKRFGGAGSFVFGTGTAAHLRPEWWGADGDGVVDSTIPFQNCSRDACATSIATGTGATVRMGANSNYLVNDTVLTNQYRVHWEGAGKYSTLITFNPISAKPLFKAQMTDTALEIAQGSFKNFSLTGGGAQQKIAFDLYDISDFSLEHIVVQSSWTGNSGNSATPSMGIRTHGRELTRLVDLTIFTDRPIHIVKNPNGPSLSADHFHGTDLYWNTLISTEAGILIDGDAAVSSFTLDGHQAWVGGKYGIRALPGGGAQAQDVSIGPFRYEQPGDNTGFAIDWEMITHQFHLHNGAFGGVAAPTNSGAKLRNVIHTTFDNITYTGTGGAVALDMDSTCTDIRFIQTFFQDGSVVSMPGFEELEGYTGSVGIGRSAIKPNSFWQSTANTEAWAYQCGVPTHKAIIVSLAVGGAYTLYMGSSGGAVKTGQLKVSAYSATGPTRVFGIWHIDGTGSTLGMDVHGNCSAVNAVSKFCTIWNSASSIQLFNNLAQAVKVLIEEEWTT